MFEFGGDLHSAAVIKDFPKHSWTSNPWRRKKTPAETLEEKGKQYDSINREDRSQLRSLASELKLVSSRRKLVELTFIQNCCQLHNSSPTIGILLFGGLLYLVLLVLANLDVVPSLITVRILKTYLLMKNRNVCIYGEQEKQHKWIQSNHDNKTNMRRSSCRIIEKICCIHFNDMFLRKKVPNFCYTSV